MLTLSLTCGATAAHAVSLPGELPDLGSIGRPNPYPFAQEPQAEISSSDATVGFLDPEPGDPSTVGAGTPCPSVDGSGPWELTRTYWYVLSSAFEGRPYAVELHAGQNLGMVLYERSGFDDPTVANRIACYGGPGTADVDLSLGDLPDDHWYLLQVGHVQTSPDNFGEAWDIRGSYPPSNDAISAAAPLPRDTPVEVTTLGATADGTEPESACDAFDGGGHTVWLSTTAKVPGDLRIDAHSIAKRTSNASISIFTPSGEFVDCVAGSSQLQSGATQLEHAVEAGDYLIRISSPSDPYWWVGSWHGWWAVTAHVTPVDRDDDGYYRPADCNDADAEIHPGAIDAPEDGIDQDCSGGDGVNYDRDGDTHQRPSDCNDRDPTIHPGAIETLDDGIDQNCDGRDDHRDRDSDGIADYEDRCPQRSSGGIDEDHDGCRDPIQLLVTAQGSLSLLAGRLHVENLTVRAAPGVRIVMSCTKHACAPTTRTLRKASVSVGNRFAPHVEVGATITIAVSMQGALGMVKQYRVSTSGMRVVRQWCTAAGSGRRVVCR